MSNKPTQRPRTIRCAIYTRKSTEEGLDQQYNSLDSQRDAGEAYIRSQANEGWELVPDRYDDGGFSGGNIERPALKRMMEDIQAGKIDCVVVYKVDRLSRSLLDFARVMETFDKFSVSFVSVTQHFNTTHSMGRLTLNILLSFAQFEREIIGERIRDKLAAQCRRGQWTGGYPVLGYDVDRSERTPKLVINPEEATKVRRIFSLYLELKNLLPVVEELEKRGWTNKLWHSKKGLSSMRDRVTFCIKTIHRPHCCATLVRSIYEHCGDDRPLICVLDDGKPELRFSQVCPDEAALVDRLIETEFDIGLSVGRNRLVEAARTRMVIFSDDDHVVGPQTRLNDLVRKFESSRLDLLATLSKQPHRPNPDGTPRLLNSSGGVLHIPRGEYRRIGDIAECAFVCNCFVAHRDILQAIRWDDDLKVDEHWDFFWRAKIAGVRVGVAMDHVFPHIHVDPPAYKRHRPVFLRAALRKHGLRKVLWK